MKETKLICQICQQTKSASDGVIAELIRPSLAEFIKKTAPSWNDEGFICFEDLGKFRQDYVREVLQDEVGELTALDHEVIESLREHELVSTNISREFEKELTFGEQLSDRIAEFGGSWKFLISFGVVLLIWIVVNAVPRAHSILTPSSS